MSSNFSFNNIDINKKNINKIDIYKNNVKKNSLNKKNINKKEYVANNNVNKKYDFFENKKNSLVLEDSYKASSFLLEAIQKQKEKNIFEKYYDLIEKNDHKILNNNTKNIIQNISMKKKFLIILHHCLKT